MALKFLRKRQLFSLGRTVCCTAEALCLKIMTQQGHVSSNHLRQHCPAKAMHGIILLQASHPLMFDGVECRPHESFRQAVKDGNLAYAANGYLSVRVQVVVCEQHACVTNFL